jgi:exopolyphosphatase / guanosine-5'-triphosphate,3'-diphosphate pyrophosphatase
VGSSTARLVVARCGAFGVDATHTERVRLSLAREIERHRRISGGAKAATAEAVRRPCSEARTHGAETVDLFVTAPGRQAKNGVGLVEEIERAAGLPVRILSAQEEAELAFRGAIALTAPTSRLVAVVDLGGASTEIALGRPEGGPRWSRSVDLGARRLATRLLDGEQPDPPEVDAAREDVADAFAGVTPPLPEAAIAVGGSARALGRVLGPCLGPAELAAAVSMLPVCPHEALVRRFGVGRQRAALLLPAALILAEAQRRLLVPLLVGRGGVREGALLAAITRTG